MPPKRSSSGLTQSRDAARQQQNQAQGYDPDALQRTLDFIGRQFGGSRSAGPSAGSRVVDWIGRQFGSGDSYAIGSKKNPVVTDPYAKGPAQDAWFNSIANSPTPFGPVQYGPPAPAPRKPVTNISSGPAITKKLNEMIGPPQEPPPVTTFDFMPPNQGQDDRSLWSAVGEQPPAGPPPPTEVDMRAGPMPPDINLGPLPARNPTWQEQGDANRKRLTTPAATTTPFGLPKFEIPGIIKNYMPQTRDWAQGGPVGLMRGGYPELFGAAKMPVRHTFDSGGQNFVGNEYGGTSGRADDVNARLSPKEYVMDSESMSLLGDGNPDHGAKKMDEMRANLRRHKGQALAKGKFSPKAKSAQEYLVGNPMGDGLRRRGKDKG